MSSYSLINFNLNHMVATMSEKGSSLSTYGKGWADYMRHLAPRDGEDDIRTPLLTKLLQEHVHAYLRSNSVGNRAKLEGLDPRVKELAAVFAWGLAGFKDGQTPEQEIADYESGIHAIRTRVQHELEVKTLDQTVAGTETVSVYKREPSKPKQESYASRLASTVRKLKAEHRQSDRAAKAKLRDRDNRPWRRNYASSQEFQKALKSWRTMRNNYFQQIKDWNSQPKTVKDAYFKRSAEITLKTQGVLKK